MSSALSCPECGTPHAVDQRYCTTCGHRVRALPATVAHTLAAMAGERRVGVDRLNSTAAIPGGAITPTGAGGPSVMLFGSPVELPSPRALMVAVLAVLAFGVIISSGNFSLASSPLLVTVHRPASSATSGTTPLALSSGGNTGTAPAAGSGGGGGGGGGSAASTATSTTSSGSTTTSPAVAAGLPPISHVWVIELGDQGYASTFDQGSPDTYLSTTLAKQGQVVPDVYASATSDLANEVGLISGQGPTVQTEANCPKYTALKPGSLSGTQVKGSGCVYPKSTPTMMSELTAAHDTWKAYVQGLGTTTATGCEHPGLGAKDSHNAAKNANSYVTWRNPVVYFAGLTSLKSCGTDDTGLAALTTDLKTTADTPNVSFIFPNPCDDGSDTPCHKGAPAGTKQSDKFLKKIVPEIQASPAYKKDGMILITFAQAPQNVATPDQSSCCDQPTKYPNLPSANYEPPAGTTATAAPTTSGTGTATTGTGTVGTSTASANRAASATPAPDDATSTTSTTAASPYTEATTTSAATTPPATSSTPATVPPTTTTAAATCVPATTTGTDTTTTGTDTTGTDTTATATTCVCPTTADTTTTATDTTTTATTGTSTDTTATDDACVCPSDATTTVAGTDTTDTSSTTGTTTTGTGTDTTGTTEIACVCPSDTEATTVTGTDTTGTDSTTDTATTGTDTTGTPTVVECVPAESTATSGTTGGGGQVGMLALSKYVTNGQQDAVDMFNTYSITASIEQLFGLSYTGYGATQGLPLFSGFFYSNPAGS